MTEISGRILTYEDFADKVDEQFVIVEDGVPAQALRLTECEHLPMYQGQPSVRPSFSLIFVADTAQMLPQRLYRLEQEKLGVVDIFLVPVGKDSRGFQYQAAFN